MVIAFSHSVLWHCWLGGRKGIRPLKTECWGAGVVICLEQGVDCLHMVQLMPLPLSVSCFTKIQIGFTFLVPAHPGSPDKVSGSGIRWAICKSAPHSRHITTPAPQHSVSYYANSTAYLITAISKVCILKTEGNMMWQNTRYLIFKSYIGTQLQPCPQNPTEKNTHSTYIHKSASITQHYCKMHYIQVPL